MTDYTWADDLARFRELLDEGVGVICRGLGGMLFVCEKHVNGTYTIYGTTYATWEEVAASDVSIYLEFLDPDPAFVDDPSPSEIIDRMIDAHGVYEFATGWILCVKSDESRTGFVIAFGFFNHSGSGSATAEIIGVVRTETQLIRFDVEGRYTFRALMKYGYCEDPNRPILTMHHIEMHKAEDKTQPEIDEDSLPF